MTKPLRFGSQNPSLREQKRVEKALNEAWKKRNKIKDIKAQNLTPSKLSKKEIQQLCGF